MYIVKKDGILIGMFFQKLLEELENEDLDIPAHIREARFEELRKQAAQFEGMRDRHHGLYRYGNVQGYLI